MTQPDPLIAALKRAFPDARPVEQRGQIATPFGLATPIYCASCGVFGGYTYCSTEFMFYLCDEKQNGCDKYGTGLDLPIVDPDTLRAAGKGGT